MKGKQVPGGRIVRSLKTTDYGTMLTRYGAINTLRERGDWAAIVRWIDDELSLTDLTAAVRDGDYDRLRRTDRDGVVRGPQVDRYLQTAEATLAPSSFRSYRTMLTALAEELGRDYYMPHLTRERAEEWLHEDKPKRWGKRGQTVNEPWSGNTQKVASKICGALWRRVIEAQAELSAIHGNVPLLTRNPWAKAKLAAKPKTRVSFMTELKWRELFAKVKDTPQAAYLACAFLAGLRQEEIRFLRRDEDIGLGESPVLRV